MNQDEKILEILTELRKDVSQINGRLDRIETAQAEQSKTLAEHGKNLAEHGSMLVKHGKLLEELDQRSARTQILLETDYHDKLQLLYDGHAAIMEKLEDLTPKSRVEALEDTVDMLKDVIKLMRQDIAELKKAQ